MKKVADKKLYRALDANFNRAKEGLRVCEDVFRFLYDDEKITKKYKNTRHQLTAIFLNLKIKDIIEARDSNGDVGRKSIPRELKRKDVRDLIFANSQRVKESIRVLEECSKLMDTKLAEQFKKLRYRVYALEKETINK